MVAMIWLTRQNQGDLALAQALLIQPPLPLLARQGRRREEVEKLAGEHISEILLRHLSSPDAATPPSRMLEMISLQRLWLDRRCPSWKYYRF